MHPNPIYHGTSDAEVFDLLRMRAFGTLAISSDPTPLLAHVPFVLIDNDRQIEFHLMRSNPLLRRISEPRDGVFSVMGPDGYISPDWYEIDDQVPTWNYQAVHLRGQLQSLPTSELRDHLDRLSASFESRLAPKPAWTTDKMLPETLARMMRMIVPCRMSIDEVQSTWKLGQNKPDGARTAAARSLASSEIGHETAHLAAMMDGNHAN